jgi:hypothetical protein
LTAQPELLAGLQQGIQQPRTAVDVAAEMLVIYEQLLSLPDRQAVGVPG